MAERTLVWADPWEKARWLDAAATLDAAHPLVRSHARMLRTRAKNNAYQFAVLAHRFCRDRIKYQRDIGGEEFADSAAILMRGFDDCDGKSRLFVALCRASGLPIAARIVPIFDKAGHFRHVQAECAMPGAPQELVQPNGWILVELTLRGVELGQGAESARRDALTGRLDLA
mgnify:CR=1 FL=1|jgi:transglutaminase-like putative cysteine protease